VFADGAPAGGAFMRIGDIKPGWLTGRPLSDPAPPARAPRGPTPSLRTAIGHGGNTFGFTADAAFFPDHGLGLVVLTNVAAANAYTGAVWRRLVELLLDAGEEAERALAFGLKQTEDAIEQQIQEITLAPDASRSDRGWRAKTFDVACAAGASARVRRGLADVGTG
jgi:hypothetical protein